MIYAFSVTHPSGRADTILASGIDTPEALRKVYQHFRGVAGLLVTQVSADEVLDMQYGGVAVLTTELDL